MAQMVEHILGKDEVTGSIPVISSTYPCLMARVFLFYLNKILMLDVFLFYQQIIK